MITDYASLQTEVADHLHRTDLGSKVPTFIQMAEAKLANNIRSRKLEVTASLSTVAGTGYVTLPTDFGVGRAIHLLETPYNVLEIASENEFYTLLQDTTTAAPERYILQGEKLMLQPVPDAVYTVKLDYYQNLPPLSTNNTTNWVLTRYPYVYLYGSLLAATVYINDPTLAPIFQDAYDKSLKDMWMNHALEDFSASPLHASSNYIV